ncbi:hypothetical protein P9112_001941 [Eukaryota sp. TZLM1-RC]
MNPAQLLEKGFFQGHNGWVTSIATIPGDDHAIVTGSRDKTALVWRVTGDVTEFAVPLRSLVGHAHFISEVVVSEDGQYALTASWDQTCRLWELGTGKTSARFQGHKGDVLSVAFSPDNRQIVTGSRDKSIRIWNTLGECKGVIDRSCHDDWVSTVKVTQLAGTDDFIIVSGGWDKLVKIFNLGKTELYADLLGHNGYINSVAISPESTLCASGGKDGKIVLWAIPGANKLWVLDAEDEINHMVFHPTKYALYAATNSGVKVFDIENATLVETIVPQPLFENTEIPKCLSLAWSNDGSSLYVGTTDGSVRVYGY